MVDGMPSQDWEWTGLDGTRKRGITQARAYGLANSRGGHARRMADQVSVPEIAVAPRDILPPVAVALDDATAWYGRGKFSGD